MQTFLGILLGGGILTFLQFLIQRHDKKNDRINEIIRSIDELRKEIRQSENKEDEREAVNKRVRILQFGDELLYEPEKKHSKERFDQVLSDITSYEKYCEKHPEFKNNQTAATVAHISKIYSERLEKHDFL